MKVYGDTNIGNRRNSNQDAFKVKALSENFVWSIVCDGMGGVNGGDIASNTAIDKIEETLNSKLSAELSNDDIKSVMLEAVNEGNSAVFSKAVDNPELKGMGTTVVLAVVRNNDLFIAHVGDSRAYLYKDGTVNQITEDHSYVQNLVNLGQITKEEAKNHPHKNIITRSLGVHSMVEIDFLNIKVENGMALVICTDGLSDYLSETILAEFIIKCEQKDISNALIEYALKCGGSDNVTASIIYC